MPHANLHVDADLETLEPCSAFSHGSIEMALGRVFCSIYHIGNITRNGYMAPMVLKVFGLIVGSFDPRGRNRVSSRAAAYDVHARNSVPIVLTGFGGQKIIILCRAVAV